MSSGQCPVELNWPLTTGNWPLPLGFDSHVADAANQVVGSGLALFHGHHFDGIRLVMGPKNQVVTGNFNVLDRAIFVLEHGVHIEFAFAIGLE